MHGVFSIDANNSATGVADNIPIAPFSIYEFPDDDDEDDAAATSGGVKDLFNTNQFQAVANEIRIIVNNHCTGTNYCSADVLKEKLNIYEIYSILIWNCLRVYLLLRRR